MCACSGVTKSPAQANFYSPERLQRHRLATPHAGPQEDFSPWISTTDTCGQQLLAFFICFGTILSFRKLVPSRLDVLCTEQLAGNSYTILSAKPYLHVAGQSRQLIALSMWSTCPSCLHNAADKPTNHAQAHHTRPMGNVIMSSEVPCTSWVVLHTPTHDITMTTSAYKTAA